MSIAPQVPTWPAAVGAPPQGAGRAGPWPCPPRDTQGFRPSEGVHSIPLPVTTSPRHLVALLPSWPPRSSSPPPSRPGHQAATATGGASCSDVQSAAGSAILTSARVPSPSPCQSQPGSPRLGFAFPVQARAVSPLTWREAGRPSAAPWPQQQPMLGAALASPAMSLPPPSEGPTAQQPRVSSPCQQPQIRARSRQGPSEAQAPPAGHCRAAPVWQHPQQQEFTFQMQAPGYQFPQMAMRAPPPPQEPVQSQQPQFPAYGAPQQVPTPPYQHAVAQYCGRPESPGASPMRGGSPMGRFVVPVHAAQPALSPRRRPVVVSGASQAHPPPSPVVSCWPSASTGPSAFAWNGQPKMAAPREPVAASPGTAFTARPAAEGGLAQGPPAVSAGGAAAGALMGMPAAAAAAGATATAVTIGKAPTKASMACVDGGDSMIAMGSMPTMLGAGLEEEGATSRRDTSSLVSQLSNVIRGLEAEVDQLRGENRSLRKAVSAKAVGESKASGEAKATVEAKAPGDAEAPSPTRGLRDPSSVATLAGAGATESLAEAPQAATESEASDPIQLIEDLAARGEAVKAEELLIQQLQTGLRPPEACFDLVIAALDRVGDTARAEEWLRRMLEASMVPSEGSFSCVILSACKEGEAQKAEEVALQMMRLRMRPGKEVFNAVLRLFASRREAPKVEEWLLNAGQSGCTPEQAAFEAAILLFAGVDAGKSEEWLSRAQQTDYDLPDACFCAVVQAFTRAGRIDKATDRLSRMIREGRQPSETTMCEVVTALAEAGDVQLADAWLAQLTSRSCAPESVETLRCALFDAALRAGDVGCAEQQFSQLTEPDAERSQRLASALAERGEAERAKAALQRYGSLGGPPTQETHTALLSLCASLGDAAGAEAAVAGLATLAPLTGVQVSLLQAAVGEARAEEVVSSQAPATAPGSPAARAAGDDEAEGGPDASVEGRPRPAARTGRRNSGAGAVTTAARQAVAAKAAAKSSLRRVPQGSPRSGARPEWASK